MMKKVFILLLIISSLFSVSLINATSEPEYNSPILDSSLNFNAKLDNGVVYTSWKSFNRDEKMKYYKVIRSSKNSDPVYPEDGYIKYMTNIDETEYKDAKPLTGVSYYRVCAITYEYNRYCSNVVKIYNEETYSTTIPETCTSWYDGCNTCGVENGKTTYCTLMYCEEKKEAKCLRYKEKKPTICTMEYAPVCGYKDGKLKTYSNKCMLSADKAYYKYSGECKEYSDTGVVNNYNLSNTLKVKAKNLINGFIKKLDSKGYSNEKKVEIIDGVTKKLNELGEKKPTLSNLINYLIVLLKEKRENYEDGFSDIEDIFYIK